MRHGYEQLFEFIDAESLARLERERPATFSSKLLGRRIPFEFTGSLVEERGDVMWLCAGTAVYGLRRDGVKYSVKKWRNGDDVGPSSVRTVLKPDAA